MKNFAKAVSTGRGLRSWAIRGLRAWVILGVTAIVVFLTLGIWRLFPIYPDEIVYRAWDSRTFLEGFERTRVWSFCGDPGQTVSIPYIFYPAATVFAGNFFIEDLSHNRVIATLAMIASFSMLWFALKRLASNEGEVSPAPPQTWPTAPKLIFCSAVLLCCLGTIPATLVMLRGETGIYVLVAVLVLSFANSRTSLSRSGLTAGFVLLLFSVSLFQHPKALYFLPASAIAMFALLWNRSRLACMAAVSCLAWTGAEGYQINKIQFLSCPDIPRFGEYVRSFNVEAAKLFADPASFVAEVLQNVGPEHLLKIARKSMFVDTYDVGYLPPVNGNVLVEITNSAIGICWIILVLVSIGVVIWDLLRIQDNLFRPAASRRRGELIELVGMLALYAGAMAQMFLNKTAWFYDCSYWFWIFIFLAAPSLLRALNARLTADNYAIKRLLAGGFCLVLLSSILSTVLSAETFYQDFNAGFGGPGIPIVTLNPAATQLSIERALAQCELSPAAPRLMVDDLTYPFVQKSYKPISVSYALFLTSFLTSSGISPQEAVIRAKALASSGMIFRCSNATAFPNLSFKEDGGICCTKFGE